MFSYDSLEILGRFVHACGIRGSVAVLATGPNLLLASSHSNVLPRQISDCLALSGGLLQRTSYSDAATLNAFPPPLRGRKRSAQLIGGSENSFIPTGTPTVTYNCPVARSYEPNSKRGAPEATFSEILDENQEK